VALVKRGEAAIKEWRREHPRERLNLSGADLSWADLSRASLSRADLSDSDVHDADLREACLDGAILIRANLLGANLFAASVRGADLVAADLRRANLSEANLSGANVAGANLLAASLRRSNVSGANLSGAGLTAAVLYAVVLDAADFSQAECGRTTFADCDLSSARGLEAAHHVLPSNIGVDTLVRTLQGAGGHFSPSQRTFFEEAGVPKPLLDYLPSVLESHPIQFFSCFISYGTPDEAFADRLYQDVKARGVSCWKYDEDALVGHGVAANIDQAIVLHDKVVVVCSESSLQRPWVLREIERALQREDNLIRRQAAAPGLEIDTGVLVPVRLDDYVLTRWEQPRKADVVAKHIGDFRGWDKDEKNYKRGMQQLLRTLDPRSKLGLSAGPGTRRPV